MENQKPLKIKDIGLSWIMVNNFDQALEFFTKKLGLKIEELNQEYGWAELVSENALGHRLGIALENPEEKCHHPGQNAVMTMEVSNIDQAKEDLKKKGVKLIGDIIEVPGVVKMLTFEDPDKNCFQLCEQIK